jgi:hypothetical protein
MNIEISNEELEILIRAIEYFGRIKTKDWLFHDRKRVEELVTKLNRIQEQKIMDMNKDSSQNLKLGK